MRWEWERINAVREREQATSMRRGRMVVGETERVGGCAGGVCMCGNESERGEETKKKRGMRLVCCGLDRDGINCT